LIQHSKSLSRISQSGPSQSSYSMPGIRASMVLWWVDRRVLGLWSMRFRVVRGTSASHVLTGTEDHANQFAVARF
jgi:hypothetical protein